MSSLAHVPNRLEKSGYTNCLLESKKHTKCEKLPIVKHSYAYNHHGQKGAEPQATEGPKFPMSDKSSCMECFHSRHHNEACLAINPPAVEEGSSLFN
jgi:hypothetical protein